RFTSTCKTFIISNESAHAQILTLSLHDALPILRHIRRYFILFGKRPRHHSTYIGVSWIGKTEEYVCGCIANASGAFNGTCTYRLHANGCSYRTFEQQQSESSEYPHQNRTRATSQESVHSKG